MNENTVLPVSSLAEGQYGLDDICLGLPSIVGANGVKKILEISLNENELYLLQESARKIKAVVNSLNFLYSY